MKISLFLNHSCNLRCRYCYNGEKFQRRMPWEVAKKGVDLALSDHRRRVQLSFFGGEPLLEMPLIKRVVDYAENLAAQKGKLVRFVMTTNGTLLTEKRLDYLLEHGFHLGVSLDGDKAAHDANRVYPSGRSSHSRISRNLEHALKRYPALEVIAVMDPRNAGRVDRSFRYLFDLGVRDLTFNMNYEGEWTDDTCDELEAVFERLGEAYLEKARQGHYFTVNPLDAKIITRLKEGYCDSDRCDFGCQEIAISPRGNFYPCERLVGTDEAEDVIIGNIWEGLDVARRDELRNAKNKSRPQCEGCILMPRCMFWCGCVNYASTGRVDGLDGRLCWSEQLFIKTADRVAGILYKEKNPVFLERYYLSAGSIPNEMKGATFKDRDDFSPKDPG